MCGVDSRAVGTFYFCLSTCRLVQHKRQIGYSSALTCAGVSLHTAAQEWTFRCPSFCCSRPLVVIFYHFIRL